MHCYIAAVRADLQVDTITMPATGFLSMSKDAAAAKNYLSPAGFKGDWVDWSDRQLAQFFEREALHFATIGPPTSNRSGACSTDKQLCFGDCFLDELPPDFVRRSQVIPTPSHVLDRISPIFTPFFPVFCAFSPSR